MTQKYSDRAPTQVTEEHVIGAASLLACLTCAGATIYLCRAMSGGMTMPGGWTMSMAWMRMPGQGWPASAGMFLGMWLPMMVAMMLPSAFPILVSYRRSLRAAGQRHVGAASVWMLCGYFFVWEGIGALSYVLGVVFAAATMRWTTLSQAEPALAGAVLIGTGWIQLTSWKRDQLHRCRVPATCVPSRGPADGRAAYNRGLRFGAHCSGCCSGFIVAMLVLGVMNLIVMVMIAAAINMERLVRKPDLVVRLSGYGLVTGGVGLLVRGLELRFSS